MSSAKEAVRKHVQQERRQETEKLEKKIQSEFYDRNGRECLALFQAWETEKGQLGTNGADTQTEDALLRWIKKRVDTIVEQVYIQRSNETNVSEDTFLVGWEEKAVDIMLGVTRRLRTGEFKDHRNLLGYAFKSRQYAWNEFGRGVTRLIREGGRLPLFTGMDDHDRDNGQIPEEIEQFDFEQLPIPATSVWVLYADIIPWLSATDQEFLLVCRLVAGNKEAARSLMALSDDAFDKCKTRIRARCQVIARVLKAFRVPGEYLIHTKERLEGFVLSLSIMDSKRHPGTFDDAVEMAKQAYPLPLQRVVHSEETQRVRKLLLTLYGRRNDA